MLKNRILSTLKFFDLQDCPLTFLELQNFLLPEAAEIMEMLDERGELKNIGNRQPSDIGAAVLFACLKRECAGAVICESGYYALAGRGQIIRQRLDNYFYGIKREQLIKKYLPALRRLPFVRGAAVLGSQALGMPRATSDIDLLILVNGRFMGLARLFITAYFQILGKRRHGKKVANRFCLNHYLAFGKTIEADRNLYTAAEYLKLRPIVGRENFRRFQEQNATWLLALFPNAGLLGRSDANLCAAQRAGERLFRNSFGLSLEKFVKNVQYRQVNRGEFIVVSADELSFHPNNRKQQLFQKFFAFLDAGRPPAQDLEAGDV